MHLMGPLFFTSKSARLDTLWQLSLSAGEKTETARKINKYMTMLVFHTFTKSEMAKVSELTC